jgi:hypothetical protein
VENFRMKKCKCGTEFRQYNSLNSYCSYDCKRKYSKPVNLKLKDCKPIKKVSDKRKIENLKYQVLRIEFLSKPENQKCPITGKQTTDIHHKKGRIGDLLLDTTYWVALSREGHKFVEENPIWAKENGYSLNRLSNEKG